MDNKCTEVGTTDMGLMIHKDLEVRITDPKASNIKGMNPKDMDLQGTDLKDMDTKDMDLKDLDIKDIDKMEMGKWSGGSRAMDPQCTPHSVVPTVAR